MEPAQPEDYGPIIRPPLSSIPHFIFTPPPRPFPPRLVNFKSTIPTDPQVPLQPPILDVSLNLSVSPSLFFGLIPRLYPSLQVENLTIEAIRAPTYCFKISNTPANKSLLYHALYGMLLFSPSKPPPLVSHVIAANIHGLSAMLCRVPTFVVSLEASPYFGVAGLEARLILPPIGPPTTSPPSYHLLGISDPEKDIPNLESLLRHICPNFPQRLLGVTADLTKEQHNSVLGITASRTIIHFMRLVSRGPFITPDATLEPPPLTPPKLVALSQTQVIALVDQYRPRLEQTWQPQVFTTILNEAERLRAAKIPSQSSGDGMLEHAWALVAAHYPNLSNFAAVLATAFAYKPSIRTRPHITCDDETNPALVAEFMLHARQFVTLRKILVA